MAATIRAFLGLSILLAGLSSVTRAQDTCESLFDIINQHLPTLAMSEVAVNIFKDPTLKGTLFLPHGGAFYKFMADLQTNGLTSKDDVNSIIGPLFLYHFLQDNVITATDLKSNAIFKTASTFTCGTNMLTVLPKNLTAKVNTTNITMEGQASRAYLGANTTILAKDPIPFCGGNVFIVDTVLLPCGDPISLINELRKTQPNCTVNVRQTLVNNNAAAFAQLLMMTGVGQDLLYMERGYTVFAPTDAAVLGKGWDTVGLKYASLFATNKDLLKQLLKYYIVPTGSFKLSEMVGKSLNTSMDTPPCASSLRVTFDSRVQGARFSAPVPVADLGACYATVHIIDHVLTPCCANVKDILAGDNTVTGFLNAGDNAALSAVFSQLSNTYSTLKSTRASINVIVPNLEAMNTFLGQAGKLTTSELNELLMYHMTQNTFDPTAKGNTTLTTLLSNIATPIVCPTNNGFKLLVEGGLVASSAAALRGDPKLVSYNTAITDGVSGTGRVLYNVTGCDGNITVVDRFMLPCTVTKLQPNTPLVVTTTTSPTGTVTTTIGTSTSTKSGTTATVTAKNAAAARGIGASIAMALATVMLAVLL